MPRTILLVDDDETLRGVLAEQLQLQDEFATQEAGTAKEAVEAVEAEQFDAVILDIGLPDMDGRELCRAMRSRGVKVPIVMLTGVDTDADTVLGFDAGANDYVTKPFRFEVLLARLRAHLRQHQQSHDAALDIGGYKFRPAYKQLLDGAGGRTVRLTEKETAILQYLYRAGGATVSRETLLREVWGYRPGITTHTLETHIYRLRQKIERDPSRTRILMTEPGGYRLAS